MSKAKVFLWLCLSFIGGVAIGSWLTVSNFYAYLIFLLSLILLIVFWLNKRIKLIGLGGIFLFLGILRFNLSLPILNDNQVAFYNGRSVNFVGLIKKEPDRRIDQTKLTIGEIKLLNGGLEKSVAGQVLLKVNLYPEYNYGNRLKIYCQLKEPGQIEDFDYNQYLARYDIYSVCYFPTIELLAVNQGNQFYQFLFKIKNSLENVINQSLTEPQAALLNGLILGERGNISQELNQQFINAGIVHIVAISGQNITIIAGLLMNLMIFLYIGRRKGFYLAVAVLILFIMLIGAPASAVRAGIMGILILFAQQVGRLSRSFNAVIFAAAVMLAINPKLLSLDVGWQLSFLAVLGLIWLKPLSERLWPERRDRWQIRDSLEMTLAAQIMTLPWLIYKFGRLSLIAPLTNILVLPVLPIVMMWGLMASLVGLVYLPLAKILFWPLWLILTYILKVVAMMNAVPFASLSFKFHWWLVILVYFMITIWLVKLKRKYNFFNKY